MSTTPMRRPHHRGRFLWSALALGPLWLALAAAADEIPGETQPASQTTQAEQQIAALIEQLGADQYARRERAQEQLRELGLSAFDALLEASQHTDVEIALRARYLVLSIPVAWANDSDSPAVRSILANYSQAGRDERQNRMQHLTALPASQGIPALCRVMRFESDSLLSKQAALYVLGHQAPDAEVARDELAGQIRSEVDSSRRPAAAWLRIYADTLEDPHATVEDWERIVREEERALDQFPDRTDREIVRDLFRWHADTLRQIGQQEKFLAVIQRTLDLIEGERAELFDFVDWALEREAWAVVDEVAKRYPTEFYKHAILVYRLAEAQWMRGDHGLANQTAAKALQIAPDHPESHNLLAEYLTMRLLYDWAEAEYRFVIANTTPTPNDGLHLEARFFLAELLFDLEKFDEAAEVMQGAVEAIVKDAKILQPHARSADKVRGAVHYYRGLALGMREEHEQQKEELLKAVELDPTNPDVLIAMYRVPDAEDGFRADTLERMNAYQGRLRDRIQLYERVLQNPRNETERVDAMDLAARSSNELAWLIANTEGDFDGALRHSQRSLELKPDSPAYLDTLGRCYYALGDYENAVKYQSRAVERAPFYQQIRRQLELFEKALARSQGEKDV